MDAAVLPEGRSIGFIPSVGSRCRTSDSDPTSLLLPGAGAAMLDAIRPPPPGQGVLLFGPQIVDPDPPVHPGGRLLPASGGRRAEARGVLRGCSNCQEVRRLGVSPNVAAGAGRDHGRNGGGRDGGPAERHGRLRRGRIDGFEHPQLVGTQKVA